LNRAVGEGAIARSDRETRGRSESPGRLAGRFAALQGRDEAAFVPFLMGGDRGLDTTLRLAMALVEAGSDVIELGVPFSDPMADGPVHQRAAERALRSGTTLHGILDLVVELRRRTDVPIVLFGYANPFYRFGPESLAEAAARAGVDALLCVDTPPEEADELRLPLRDRGLDMIFLLAPTSTPERIQRVLGVASGFVYFVSVTGVTGVKTVDPAAIEPMVRRIRSAATIPVGVGFGVSTPEQARSLAAFSDAVVVGSWLSRLVEEAADADAAVESVGRAARELKAGTRRAGARA
jgi:tryptophan synthase alpha chain